MARDALVEGTKVAMATPTAARAADVVFFKTLLAWVLIAGLATTLA